MNKRVGGENENLNGVAKGFPKSFLKEFVVVRYLRHLSFETLH